MRRHGRGVDLGRHAAGAAPARAGGRAGRSRSRRSARARRRRARPAAASRVQRRHHRDRRAPPAPASASPRLTRRRDHAGAERLGQHERVAGAAAGVGQHARRGATTPVTARPYFGSRSSIEWPPTTAAPGLRPPRRRRRAGSRAATSAPSSSSGKATRFSAVSGRAAHRVDVGQRVGGGDAPEVVGVVDDRREEVDGLHDRQRRRVSR